MTVYALIGAKGAPGVTTTTLAIALAWSASTLVVDADPAGGTLNTGYLGAQVRAADGIARLAGAAIESIQQVLASQLVNIGQSPDGARRLMLPGLSSPAQAAGIAPRWPLLADCFAALQLEDGRPLDVVVDCGRLAVEYRPDGLLDRAAAVLVVVRSDLSSVSLAHPTVNELRRRCGDRLALAVVHNGPYSPAEVATELKLPLALTMPWLPGDARDVAAGKASTRCRLLRAVHRSEGDVRAIGTPRTTIAAAAGGMR